MPDAYKNRGVAYLHKDYKAIADFNKDNKNQTDAEAYYNRGLCRQRRV